MTARLLAAFLLAGSLPAEEVPNRIGRLSFLYGAVSYRPGHAQDWGDAVLNFPLSDGDHLWTDLNAQAEIRAGAAFVHLAPQTGFSIVTLNDRAARLSVSEGAANIRISRMNEDERVEVATPTGTFRLLRPGSYRVDVVPAGNYVSLAVRSGAAEVSAGPQTAAVAPGQRVVLAGNPASIEFLELPEPDAWDEWCAERDAAFEEGIVLSEPYVDWDLPGAEELAANGDWEADGDYGACWVPRSVSSDWTPFRHGRWIFKLPWGWTWVDDAQWGFAPSHFGRWAKIKRGWSWIPGHRHRKEPYSPATVAFAPGGGRIVWAPLAPGESPAGGARRNRDAANSAEVAAFRTSRPIGPGRLSGAPVAFTARTPDVEPAPEALFAGHIHPKPEAEARALAPPPPAAPAIPRPEPAQRTAVEDHRSVAAVLSEPTPEPPPSPAPVHVEESRHSDPPQESRHVDDSPPPPRHSDPPRQQHALPPPVPAQHVESHSTVQEHRVEAPRAAESSRSSSNSGGRRK